MPDDLNLRKVLEKRKLKKTVDLGPISPLTTKKGPETIDIPKAEIKPTPVASLIKDIYDEAEQVIKEIQDLMLDIRETNRESKEFNEYADLVDKNRINPLDFLDKEEEVERAAKTSFASVKLKTLEKKVLRNVNDPRAGIYHDLSLLEFSVRELQYGIRRIWNSFQHNLNYVDRIELEDTSLLRLSLYKDLQRLRKYKYSVKRYRDLSLTSIAECIVDNIASLISIEVRDLSEEGLRDAISWVNKRIRQLKTIRNLLLLASVKISGKEWERIKEDLTNYLLSPLSSLTRSIEYEMKTKALSLLRKEIEEIVNPLNELALNTMCVSTSDILNYIRNEVFEMAALSEASLMEKTRRYKIESRTRRKLTEKAIEIYKNKQYIVILNSAIKMLSEFKTRLEFADDFASIEYGNAVDRIKSEWRKTLESVVSEVFASVTPKRVVAQRNRENIPNKVGENEEGSRVP